MCAFLRCDPKKVVNHVLMQMYYVFAYSKCSFYNTACYTILFSALKRVAIDKEVIILLALKISIQMLDLMNANLKNALLKT